MATYPMITRNDDGSRLVTMRLPQHLAAADTWTDYDLWSFADDFESILHAVASIRRAEHHDDDASDDMTAGEWSRLVRITQRMHQRLRAIRAHAIRAHAAAGGSITDLRYALEVPRSTAADERRRAADDSRYAYSGWVRGDHQKLDISRDSKDDSWPTEMAAALREALSNGGDVAAIVEQIRARGVRPDELLMIIPREPLTDDE